MSIPTINGAEASATYLGATPRWIVATMRRARAYLTGDGPDGSGGPERPDEKETT